MVARGPASPGLEADARYLLGHSLGASADRDGMSAEWAAVLRLHAVAASPGPLLAMEKFGSVAEAALAELPQELLDRLGNVAVLIADRPSPPSPTTPRQARRTYRATQAPPHRT